MPAATNVTSHGVKPSIFANLFTFVGKLASAILFVVVEPSDTYSADVAVPPAMASCLVGGQSFENDVWAKVGERTCLRCHHSKGEASASEFVLRLPDPLSRSEANSDWLKFNHTLFERIAKQREGDHSRMLLKATGGMEHGGGEVLRPDSPGYQVLSRYVHRISGVTSEHVEPTDAPIPPLFDEVKMLSASRLLRRVTLSLCGRLPTPEERHAVHAEGERALEPILDRLMTEEAFYQRLREAFNDIFLTVGIEDNAETILSYDHFEKSRLWYQTHDLSPIPDAEQERARWKLADVYREAMLREPLELITHIVRNDKPFTEIVTADYIMVSPYTARGYGIFEAIKHQFKDANDPFEYIPAKLNALVNRAGKTQESATGLYPHAGFLSTFHYLRRYPSTETNRNRLRARMLYQHFLGVDVMQLAPRSTDASAVAAKFDVPTMQASDCVICHVTIDPVAGIFQDYDFEGHIGPRKDGWYQDMFVAGFEGEELPASERWRAPQWLAERVAQDPRFSVAMIEHVYYALFGRKPMAAPEDIEDPCFSTRRHAYRDQRRMIEEVANQFTASGFNLKVAFKSLIGTNFYRADHLALTSLSPAQRAAFDDLGVVRLLSPEQLERKLKAIFGESWGRLDGEMKILYGGIDSITVTERNADPSGAMGAIQRMMANDVACYHVARDFRKEPAQRLLFPKIEPDTIPGNDAADLRIRETIVSLHQRLLGQEHKIGHEEVERTIALFTSLMNDAKAQPHYAPRETYFCGGREEFNTEDPHYTIRAWRGVVTYLLRQHDFLYE
jgi:hypothetical protein